jgi:hypothetical protein
MVDHLRAAFTIARQDFDTIDVEVEPSPLDQISRPSRRVVLNEASVSSVGGRFRIVPLARGPAEDAPFRVFRIVARRTP